MTTIAEPMTADAFFDWCRRPENADRRFELTEEGVVEMPLPSEQRNTLAGWLIALLWQYVAQVGRGRVSGTGTGIILRRNPDVVRGPDVVFHATSRKFDYLYEGYSDETPTFVAEILSRNDRFTPTNRRVQEYLMAGIPFVWLVDPFDEIVSVYKRKGEVAFFGVADTLDGNAVLPDLSIRVADIFKLPGE